MIERFLTDTVTLLKENVAAFANVKAHVETELNFN